MTPTVSHGFDPTAIVHSLAQASFVWAFFLFAIQGFWMTFGDFPLRIVLPIIISVAVMFVVMCFGVWVALQLQPREEPFEETQLPAPVPLQIHPKDR